MMPRLPVNIPRWGIATMSPKGVTRFCRCIGLPWAATSSTTMRRFPIEQRPLALHAPGVTRKRTVVPHHPVTRDGDGELVGRAGAGDGPGCLRRADPASDLRVGHGLARGDFLKGLPHPLLEGGTANVERQIEAETRRLDEPDDAGYEGLIVAVGPDQLRLGKAILKLADQFVGVAAEKDGRDTFLARSHQNGTERALSDCEADVLVRAAGAILCRRHPEHVGGLLVEASARIEPGIVDRLGHGVAARKTITHLRRAMRGGVILGRQPCGRLE